MPYRKIDAPIYKRKVMETPNDVDVPKAVYRQCSETSQILGQGTFTFLQGRIHQIEPSTTLRVEAFSGCACAEEEPYSSGLRVKLATPTSTNQDYIELTAPGPFHIWTEGVVQSSLELVFTIIRTGSPYVRRLEVSACACVHIP